MNKRIVLYNWVQFDNDKGKGGGVSVYLTNIIPVFVSYGYDVIFVSSGHHYDLIRTKTFYRETTNLYSNIGVKSYQIVNSPIKAPSQDSFFEIDECLENTQIADVFLDFLRTLGKIDEIHFHNIEGISTKVVERVYQLREAKVVVWLHNYHWVCPQIELFKRREKPCHDFHDGFDCIGCLPEYRNATKLKRVQRIISFFEMNRLLNTIAGHFLFFLARKLYRAVTDIVDSGRAVIDKTAIAPNQKDGDAKLASHPSLDASSYNKWRKINVARLNDCVDEAIAVSSLVKKKYISFGVEALTIKEAPLGMDIYRPPHELIKKVQSKVRCEKLRVGFLGYSSVSKGLPFLCSSLLELDQQYLDRIEFRIFSKVDDVVRKRISSVSERCSTFLVDGYERGELDEIASELDVVIVPSLWWETYNQVAYEMVMSGVPVLVSDSVGISDYLNAQFKFCSGDSVDLIGKLKWIMDNKTCLDDYWSDYKNALPSLDSHFANVMAESSIS